MHECGALNKARVGLRGGERGQGSTVEVGRRLLKSKALIREGMMEVYLHQLSARLLGWRRSWDPPAIELELPAGNNQSHCYSRSWSLPAQELAWKLPNMASRGGSQRESEEKANKLEAAIMDRKGNSYFHAETIRYIFAISQCYKLFIVCWDRQTP